MYMIMYVSRNVDQALEMLDVWVDAGVSGVTILESAGVSKIGDNPIHTEVGLMFSLSKLLRSQEVHHRTLFSAIQDETMLQKVVDISTAHVGSWDRADVGVLFVWPLLQAHGLNKKAPEKK